jgi:hypothetical protein
VAFLPEWRVQQTVLSVTAILGSDYLDDRDIWRTANLILNQFGEYANLETARRTDEMLDRGDIDGQRIWRRVMAALEELSRQTPIGSVH